MRPVMMTLTLSNDLENSNFTVHQSVKTTQVEETTKVDCSVFDSSITAECI